MAGISEKGGVGFDSLRLSKAALGALTIRRSERHWLRRYQFLFQILDDRFGDKLSQLIVGGQRR